MPFLLPLAAPCPSCCSPSPSQCVYNPSEACECCGTAVSVLSNLQVTCPLHLLLLDVLLFHFSHPFHSCGLSCLLSFLSGRNAALCGLIPAAKPLVVAWPSRISAMPWLKTRDAEDFGSNILVLPALCMQASRVVGGYSMAAVSWFCEQHQGWVLCFIPEHPGSSTACLPCSQDLVTTGKHPNGKSPNLGQTPDPKSTE